MGEAQTVERTQAFNDELREAAPLVAHTPEVLPAPPAAPVMRVTFASSASIANLITALAAAQLKFGAIERAHTAKVSSKRTGVEYSYDYADLAAVLTAVRSACAEQGIAILQPSQVGQRSVTVTTLLAHGSGEFIRNDFSLGIESGDPQSVGSAITYARRYSLQALLGVAPEADDDAAAAMPKKPNGNGQKPATVPMPERASSQPAPTPPAPATFTIVACEKKVAPSGDYWKARTSRGKDVVTFNPSLGEVLMHVFLDKRALKDLVTHERQNGNKVVFHHVDEIIVAGGAS